MARKKKPEEHENHERWLISYADFITLLFAFFVVMYSVSSVNEGKYRVMSQSMIAAFGKSVRSFEPVQEGALVRSRTKNLHLITPPSAREQKNVRDGRGKEKQGKGGNDGEFDAELMEKMSAIARELEEQLAALIDDEVISIRQLENWLEVEIKSNLLFASGSSALAASAVPVLEKIADALRSSRNMIHVEGFTDNIPISTPIYPSNWELSAARSATVVRLFADYEIEPKRMISVGYGEYRPIADNETVLGRAMNRRVVIVVLTREVLPPEPERLIPEPLEPDQALTQLGPVLARSP